MRYFDVEAVHAVVFDAQIADAGAGSLARFEIDQKLPGVIAQCAQLVELGIEAGGYNIAVAHCVCGLGQDRLCQQSL